MGMVILFLAGCLLAFIIGYLVGFRLFDFTEMLFKLFDKYL